MHKLVESIDKVTFTGEEVAVSSEEYIALKLSHASEVAVCFLKKYIHRIIHMDGTAEQFEHNAPEAKAEMVRTVLVRLRGGVSYRLCDTDFCVQGWPFENGRWYAFLKRGMYIWVPNEEITSVYNEVVS